MNVELSKPAPANDATPTDGERRAPAAPARAAAAPVLLELPPVATVDEVARFARVHRTKVTEAVRNGELRARDIGKGGRATYRFLREEVLSWLANENGACAVPSASTPGQWPRGRIGGGATSQAGDASPSTSPAPKSTRPKRTASRVSATPKGLSLREALGHKPKRPQFAK